MKPRVVFFSTIGAGLLIVLAPRAVAFQERAAQKLCPPCAAVSAAQGSSEIPEDALKDRAWALGPKGVNVPWPVDPPKGGRAAGAGATVVQIDTGVTRHPLLPMTGGEVEAGIDLHAADGLFGIGHTNIDPLVTGLLRFPGHGTKTSSVIVGRPTNEMDVRGVAPGARVIPVRATQGVMLFPKQVGHVDANYHQIARAINEAAKHDRGLFRRRVDVISMSLGGAFPTSDVCQAVENATRAGIIVVVAAGNEIKRTKYPAKCPTAIAVAGSNYLQTPWRGTAGSEEVVAAAPAEGVWTAAVFNGSFCIEASSGTSFATAIVASLAAEWAGRRRAAGTPMPSSPAEAFRADLKKSVRPWTGSDAVSWSKKYGPGIVDATLLFGGRR